MRRAIIPALVLLALLAILLAAVLPARSGGPAAADGQVRVEQVDVDSYPEVSLFVSVRDEAGALRGGLSSDDFTVTEDGEPVDLVDFRGGGQAGPLSAALVIDRSGSMEDAGKIDGAREAAATFVGQMRPGDLATIIPFSSEVEPAIGFTDNQDALHEEIGRLRADGGTALYDAVVAGVDALRDQPGRRVLLVLADGQDCSTPFDGCPDEAGSSSTLGDAIAYAEGAGQPVYVVGLGDEGDIDAGTLRRIAEETGGRYFYAPDAADLASLYGEVAGAVQQEYLLTYVSPRPFYDGTRRDIQVAVGGVAAGTGYTERHLINVASSPLVGLVLLVPLAGLLALPEVLRRRRAQAPGGSPQIGGSAPPLAPALAAPAPSLSAPPATPATIVAPAAPATIVAPPPAHEAARRCASCDHPLRPGARFCSRCGATQPVAPAPAPAAERRSFCDMCGRPLLAGAQFCTACGEPVGRRENLL